jgi:hypothetical protein
MTPFQVAGGIPIVALSLGCKSLPKTGPIISVVAQGAANENVRSHEEFWRISGVILSARSASA